MDFDLDEDQALFKASIERFCAPIDVAARLRMRRLPDGFDRERWRELAALGLIGLAASESDNGLGGSAVDCAVVARALGYGQSVEPWLECGFLAARLLAGTGHIAAVIDGTAVAALAFAEAGGRYTLEARAVKARAAGAGFTLSGEKRFVLSGAAADLFIVTARLGEETRLFAVARGTPGVEVKPYPVSDGSVAAVVILHDVAVDAEAHIGGFDRLLAAVDAARLMAAAEMAGLARRLFDDTLAYVKTREQFGQPLGRFQVIQHRMVDAYSRCEAIESALYRALLTPGASAEAAKAFIGEAAIWVAETAVQMHGGMGTTDELGICHGLKRIVLLSKLFGDPASGLTAMAKAA